MDENIQKEVYLIGELFKQLFDKYNKMENKKYLYKDMKELTIIEINTIIVIGHNQEIKSMSQIAKALGVSFGTPTVTIDRLISKGYVERTRDEEDRRQVFVDLSDKGREVYESIIELRSEVTRRVFEILDEEERDSLISILSKVNNRFDEVVSSL